LRSRLTAVIGLVLLLFSCDKIQENPLDPEGSDYTPPETFLTMEALEGSVLDTSTVTITWSGNDLVVEYAYSLNGDWSEWSSATSVTLNYLDEGAYTFSVKGRYASEVEDESPATVNFSVDMVQGPALRVYTLLTEMSALSTQNISIYAEDVEELVIIRFQVQYDASLLSLSPQAVTKGELLSGIAEMVFIVEEISAGLLEVNVGIPSHSGVTGTGSLVTLPFTSKALGSTAIEIQNAEFGKLGNISGDPESFTGIANGLVVVQ